MPEQLPPYRAKEPARRSDPRPSGTGRTPESKREVPQTDEIPFGFVRWRMSVVVEDETRLNTLICEGTVDEVVSLCSRVEVKGEVLEVLPGHDAKRRQLAGDLNGRAFG